MVRPRCRRAYRHIRKEKMLLSMAQLQSAGRGSSFSDLIVTQQCQDTRSITSTNKVLSIPPIGPPNLDVYGAQILGRWNRVMLVRLYNALDSSEGCNFHSIPYPSACWMVQRLTSRRLASSRWLTPLDRSARMYSRCCPVRIGLRPGNRPSVRALAWPATERSLWSSATTR